MVAPPSGYFGREPVVHLRFSCWGRAADTRRAGNRVWTRGVPRASSRPCRRPCAPRRHCLLPPPPMAHAELRRTETGAALLWRRGGTCVEQSARPFSGVNSRPKRIFCDFRNSPVNRRQTEGWADFAQPTRFVLGFQNSHRNTRRTHFLTVKRAPLKSSQNVEICVEPKPIFCELSASRFSKFAGKPLPNNRNRRGPPCARISKLAPKYAS